MNDNFNKTALDAINSYLNAPVKLSSRTEKNRILNAINHILNKNLKPGDYEYFFQNLNTAVNIEPRIGLL